jgi:DNA-binding NtrC family response regulator
MANILVVDDEENLSYSIRLALQRQGHKCRVADTVSAALEECNRSVPDLTLIDMQLPDGNGLDLMIWLRDRELDMPVIVVTAYGTVDNAVTAMKQGAADYLQKPLSIEEVCLSINRCLENRQIRDRLSSYQEAQRRESGYLQIVGNSRVIHEVLSLARKIAEIPAGPGLTSVLILGETGTGKELMARHIHYRGSRADRPFVHINCTAIPEALFESELFGYEKGSFTDAKADKKGLFETAHEGTLFLDEIGDMPLPAQAKLLTAIESGRFRRLGGTAERVCDVQMMAATNSDLRRKVDRGEFREDLFYRLKVFCIELPPLRNRGDDLFLLAEHFIEQFSRKFHKPRPVLSPEARQAVQDYRWPGNVRELANVLQRAVLLTDRPVLDPRCLALGNSPDGGSTSAGSSLKFDFSREDLTLATVEKKLLQAALDHARGNISEAARLLGVSRGSLRNRLEKAGLHIPS